MKNKNSLLLFGKILRQKRKENRIGLREICRKTNYDPSNWSKIERGMIAPPNDKDVLAIWAKNLGIEENSEEFHSFVDRALIAQGIIPKALSERELLELVP